MATHTVLTKLKETNPEMLSDDVLKKYIGLEALKLTGKVCVMSVAAMAAGALTTAMFGAGFLGEVLAMGVAYGGGISVFSPWFSSSIRRMNRAGRTLLRRRDSRAYHEPSLDRAFKRMKTKDSAQDSFKKTLQYVGLATATVVYGTALGFIAFAGIPWFVACATAYTGYKSYRAFAPGIKTHATDWYKRVTQTPPAGRDAFRPIERGEKENYRTMDMSDDLTRASISTTTALESARQQLENPASPEKVKPVSTHQAGINSIINEKER